MHTPTYVYAFPFTMYSVDDSSADSSRPYSARLFEAPDIRNRIHKQA